MRTGPTHPPSHPESDASSVSRRQILRGAAAGMLLPRSAHTGGPMWGQRQTSEHLWGLTETRWAQTDDDPTSGIASARLTVMTRNLYVGTNLFQAFADNPDDIHGAVGSLLRNVRDSRFDARADGIVDEIATVQPDLVGLQEVALLRIQRPGDYEAAPGQTNATETEVDFLAVLTEKLAERRLPYEVVSSVTNVDIELPATVDAGRVDVRLTDRDVILAHESVTTQNPQAGTYASEIELPFPDGVTYPLVRGYCTVEADVDGVGVTFVNTHLESVSAATQVDQARELLVTLSSYEDPVVLVGDFNSPADGDGTVTYDLLSRFFADAYAEVATDTGFTCCQKPDLRAGEPRLGRRIDFVFYRGQGAAVSATRVGDDPSDRVGTYIRGDYQRLWPSDHAGVVVTLELDGPPLSDRSEPIEAATATADQVGLAEMEETAESTTTSEMSAGEAEPTVESLDATTSTDVSAPGLGIVGGLAGLAAVAVALARRQRRP